MARLEEQIKSISQVTMNKENELKKRLETSNKSLVAARQGEFELNERIKTYEADLMNMANYEQLVVKLNGDLALEKRKGIGSRTVLFEISLMSKKNYHSS